MPNSFTINSSAIGVDLNNMSSTALFAVGTHMLGAQNTEWVYVQAQTTINALSWVAINSTFSAGMASAADAVSGLQNLFGVANGTISASSYGWIAIRGENLSALFTGTGSLAATSGELHLASSAGPTGVMMLGTVGTASCTMAMQSVYLAATATSSATGLAVGIGGQAAAANACLVNLYYPARVVAV